MRVDSQGLFWQDTDYKTEKKQALLEEEGWTQVMPGFWAEQWRLDKGQDIRTISLSLDSAYAQAKASKTSAKREPPEPVWLSPDYLPGLEEARQFNVPLFTDQELVQAATEVYTKGERHKLVFDIECYGNFFFIGFLSPSTGKVVCLELSEDYDLDIAKLKWIFDWFCVVGFNSNHYDIFIAAMAVNGCSTAMMKSATTAIIEFNERGRDVLKHYKTKKLDCDHIDLREVAPLFGSLKIYAGRMHAERMQDLPFHPDTVLSEPQRAITRWYCVNDLSNTKLLMEKVDKELTLREEMGKQYGQDLRSKSDAQIAEAIIGAEIQKFNHMRPQRPDIEPGTSYKYRVPSFIKFQTPLMQEVLRKVWSADFIVSEHGNVGLPQELKDINITMNGSTYKMGIGGLHSSERSAAHYTDENYKLVDKDVTSYYPAIILNLELYPHHLGPNFLLVYRSLVERRIQAKREGNKTVADSLKIVVNGSFGKLGNKFSILYSPDLLTQVTITGQLSLLMLIERLELNGIPVVSANTDGIVIKCPRNKEDLLNQVVSQWESDTGFDTEETLYSAIFSRDVNNYIAVKDPSTWEEGSELDDKVKTKGLFAKTGLSKNPQNEISVLAIKELLINGTPIEETVRRCNDISKFINVRTVKGGAVKLYGEGEPVWYLGKAIRWFYATDVDGPIVYAKNGNKVPKSDNAQPLMDMPDHFPTNVNYEWYEKEAMKILRKSDYNI